LLICNRFFLLVYRLTFPENNLSRCFSIPLSVKPEMEHEHVV